MGRTGAGKSSLLQALFRIVEISGGTISIDGYDVKTIGLDVLRSQLGIVPQVSVLYGYCDETTTTDFLSVDSSFFQDPLLWSGTVRDNLDPTNKHTDADLIESLRRCNLVALDDSSVEVKARLDKFRLDATVQVRLSSLDLISSRLLPTNLSFLSYTGRGIQFLCWRASTHGSGSSRRSKLSVSSSLSSSPSPLLSTSTDDLLLLLLSFHFSQYHRARRSDQLSRCGDRCCHVSSLLLFSSSLPLDLQADFFFDASSQPKNYPNRVHGPIPHHHRSPALDYRLLR